MKRSLLAVLPLMLLSTSCVEAPPEDERAGAAASALSAAQCEYFEQGGKVTICHATGGPGSPVKRIQVASSACENAHAAHAGDFIAVDGSCGPNTCLAELTPCDATLPCCEGLTCDDGVCRQPPICANESFEATGCDQNIPNGAPFFGGLATLTKSIGSAPISVYEAQTEECEFSFGPCSTFNVDTEQDLLIGSDNQYEISFHFVRPMASFSVGKVYGLGVLTFTFLKAGNVVFTDEVNRNPEEIATIDCAIGSTASWTPPSDFDEVRIHGGIFGLTDLGACTL